MDDNLKCNWIQCRKELNDRALVTTCSHIFCVECANREGLLGREPAGRAPCPACQSALSNPDDAVVTSLNPTEDYKTSVLSGLSPSIVMECAGRALSFWAYQATQEIYYQQYMNKQLKKQFENDRRELEAFVNKTQADTRDFQSTIAELKAENANLHRKNDNLEKARAALKKRMDGIQHLYDAAKMKSSISNLEKTVTDNDAITFPQVLQQRLAQRENMDVASSQVPVMARTASSASMFQGMNMTPANIPRQLGEVGNVMWGTTRAPGPTMPERVHSVQAASHKTVPLNVPHRQRASDLMNSASPTAVATGLGIRSRGSSVTGGQSNYSKAHTHGMGLSSGVKTSHTGNGAGFYGPNTQSSRVVWGNNS